MLTIIVPILINKGVFEPSYNDLKFTVWNHNYICTNLIKISRTLYVAEVVGFCIRNLPSGRKCVCVCKSLSHVQFCSPPGSSVHEIHQERTGVDSHSLLQGIFLTQGSTWGLLHCRQILYHLSHQGSPGKSLKKILKQFICSNQDQPPIHSWQLINKFLKTFKTSQIPLFSCFSSCNCLVQFPSLDFTHGNVLCCFLDFLSIES